MMKKTKKSQSVNVEQMTALLVPLPPLVTKAIRHLSSSTASSTGLFQFGCVDQHHLAATQLRLAFEASGESGSTPALESDAECAVALLLFLADLPAPLLTTTLRACFVDALAVPDAAERLLCVCDVVRLLPPLHFSLLRALCAYLRDLARRAPPADWLDAVDAFAPLLLWLRLPDDRLSATAPLPLDDAAADDESVVVIAVQSALQTAQLVLLSHLWTVAEATAYIAAALHRCDLALRWRLELLDGTRLAADDLIGALDLAHMDTLYLETDDPLVEPDYVAQGRDLLRLLVTECDAMLAAPTSARSSADSAQYGYVPRQGPAAAAPASSASTDADFDAILDSVALMKFDDDDDDDGASAVAALPTEQAVPSTPYQAFPARQPLRTVEAKRARKNLRATVTKSRMILKNENLLQDSALSRRSRGLATRAAPAHYLVAPPTSNALIDEAAPPRPRGPPPKKPAMAPARRKAPAVPVRAQYGVSRLISAHAAPAVPPRAQPTLPAAPAVAPRPQPTPSPPAAVPPRPAPRPATRPAPDDRRATLGTPTSRPAPAAVDDHRRATVAAKPTPPSTAKPLPAPPSRPKRPAAPQRSAAPTLAYSNLPAEAAKPAIAYSNLPAEAAVSTSGYDNLPAHTLRIQRANMLGGALDDGGLEIEVFDDALLGQLQQ